MVDRYQSIRYEGFDPQGQPIERVAHGFHARVVQHECDHLIGRLYPSRITDFSKFGFMDVMFRTWTPTPTSDRRVAQRSRQASRHSAISGLLRL